MQPHFGFRERAHTADWELEVWAPDLAKLLEQAAYGMYAISGAKIDVLSRKARVLTLHAGDAESLLVRFLSELLWLEQEDGSGFDRISVSITDNYNLEAELSGGQITGLDKEIKAVTYHNLEVESTPQGLQVNIVFDV